MLVTKKAQPKSSYKNIIAERLVKTQGNGKELLVTEQDFQEFFSLVEEMYPDAMLYRRGGRTSLYIENIAEGIDLTFNLEGYDIKGNHLYTGTREATYLVGFNSDIRKLYTLDGEGTITRQERDGIRQEVVDILELLFAYRPSIEMLVIS